MFKSWFVFAAFVDIEYSLNFYELSWSLAIQQFAAIPTLFIVPYLNKYKCNWLCLWLQLLGSLCIILNSILSGTKFTLNLTGNIFHKIQPSWNVESMTWSFVFMKFHLIQKSNWLKAKWYQQKASGINFNYDLPQLLNISKCKHIK